MAKMENENCTPTPQANALKESDLVLLGTNQSTVNEIVALQAENYSLREQLESFTEKLAQLQERRQLKIVDLHIAEHNNEEKLQYMCDEKQFNDIVQEELVEMHSTIESNELDDIYEIENEIQQNNDEMYQNTYKQLFNETKEQFELETNSIQQRIRQLADYMTEQSKCENCEKYALRIDEAKERLELLKQENIALQKRLNDIIE